MIQIFLVTLLAIGALWLQNGLGIILVSLLSVGMFGWQILLNIRIKKESNDYQIGLQRGGFWVSLTVAIALGYYMKLFLLPLSPFFVSVIKNRSLLISFFKKT